jgi:hypothetical protein
VAILALVGFLPSFALASHDVSGVRGGERLRLVESRLDVTMHRGWIAVRVSLKLANDGERPDQGEVFIDLPAEAVITGMRVRTHGKARKRWLRGRLVDAERARAEYRALTGFGPAKPRDPAILYREGPGFYVLQVFPCPPGVDKRIEYTFEMPTEYGDGRHVVDLSQLGEESGIGEISVRSADPKDRLTLDDVEIESGSGVDPSRPGVLAMRPGRVDRIAGTLASEFTGTRHFVAQQLYLRRRLSRSPRNARVVVLIDGSVSFEGRSDLAREMAVAYLSHLEAPGLRARVKVMTFDRAVHPRSHDFVRPTEAITDLRERPIPSANGSALDRALDEAATALRGHSGPRRIVLFSDLRGRSALELVSLEGRMARGTPLVHVVEVVDPPVGLSRRDGGDWSSLARRTGGLEWTAGPVSAEAETGDWSRGFEELVRPTRLDRLRFTGFESSAAEDLQLPQSLREGHGFSTLHLREKVARSVHVRGELWSQPVHVEFARDRRAGARWSGFILGSVLLDELDEGEIDVLARRGQVVSERTSYLAVEPGARPSTEGFPAQGNWLIGRGGGGGTGQGYGERSGAGFGPRSGRRHPSPEEWLHMHLEPAARACKAPLGSTEIRFESTGREVVDVLSVKAETKEIVACMTEATWALSLSLYIFTAERARWDVSV